MSSSQTSETSVNQNQIGEGMPGPDEIRSIGQIIRDTRNLSADQVASILSYQQKNHVRFGEAAIALGFATTEDVLHALAKQFNYAYATTDKQARNPELVVLNQPFSHQAESIRAARAQILLRTQPAGDGVVKKRAAIAVVSPATGDGKTFFSANLAIALAQLGTKTLLVDADLRGPRLHAVFGVDRESGLAGLLSGRRGDNVIKQVTDVPGLFILPVGISPPNPLELLEGPAFGLLLHELTTKFDHVIIDTPAIQYGADALVVAARCKNAVIVARKDQSRIDSLRNLTVQLQTTGTTVLGVVQNEQ